MYNIKIMIQCFKEYERLRARRIIESDARPYVTKKSFKAASNRGKKGKKEKQGVSERSYTAPASINTQLLAPYRPVIDLTGDYSVENDLNSANHPYNLDDSDVESVYPEFPDPEVESIGSISDDGQFESKEDDSDDEFYDPTQVRQEQRDDINQRIREQLSDDEYESPDELEANYESDDGQFESK
ncbi:MAG: hypothetical protein MPK62_06910, partial [Alphaproteobacteria bacterium]|nr:hypothetical protein [Alphaproteobacteria bacterium]